MNFGFEHHFDAPLDAVAAVLLDPDFQNSLADLGSLAGREVLSQQVTTGGVTVRRVRCVLGIDLGAARSFIGDGDPAWVEEAAWDPDTNTWAWVVVPEIAHEVLSASGTIGLAADRSGAGTRRIIDGQVKVRVPLFGGKVEGWIVDGLRSAYDEEATRLASWLAVRV